MKKFDAIIVGSGQAGTPLAFKLATKGKKVAFIEKEHWGGTCVNVGGDEIIILMYAKSPYTVFRDAVIPHPTITELIPTMLESAKKISKS